MVFHGSPVQDLKIITPGRYFTATEPLIYASRNVHIASLYVETTGGEFACTIVMDHRFKLPVIVERMRDGLRKRFTGKPGSIYGLKNDDFEYVNKIENFSDSDMTCRSEQVPILELQYEDSLKYVLELGNQKKIRIIPYKDRYEYLPKADMDLKRLFTKYLASKNPDPELLNMIKSFQPSLYNAVIPKKSQV
jgi:hypothetical protein